MTVSWWNTPFNTPDPLTAHIERPGASTWTFPDYQGSPWATQTPDVGWQQYDYRTSPNRRMSWYDNQPRGEIFDAISSLANRQIGGEINTWLEQTFPGFFAFPNGDVPYQPGDFASIGGEWAQVDSWNAQILQAQNQVYQQTGVYVPGNVIKAIMKIESNGEWLDTNYAGAVGLMQVTPYSMGSELYDFNRVGSDPAYNIWAGTMELALRYKDAQSQNPAYTWSNVAVGYFSGHYVPNGAGDRWNDDFAYQRMFDQYLAVLNAGTAGGSGAPLPGGGAIGEPGTVAGTQLWLSITGGIEFPITQAMGGNAMDYSNYDYTLGVTGHPGIDIGTPLDTRTYSPVHGTVVTAGGSVYFSDERYGAQAGTGELKIKLDNGDELILGHMGSINVRVGDRVTPGMLVGLSGTYNGPHIHAEYRRYSPHQYGTHIAIDPRLALDGVFTGTYSQTPGLGQSPFIPSPSDWAAFMRQAAMGGTLPGPGYEPYFGGSQWSHWLRQNAAWIPRAA